MLTCFNSFLMILVGAISGSVIHFIMLPALFYLADGLYLLDGMYATCYLLVGGITGSLITFLVCLARLPFRKLKLNNSRYVKLIRGVSCGALGCSFMVLQLESHWEAMADLATGITCGV